VGYGDTSSFRRLFKSVVGLSPSEYRKKFSGYLLK
jgi:AraC-like DNA-binding protein